MVKNDGHRSLCVEILLLLFCVTPIVLAQANDIGPADIPFVRIETGQHTAAINQLSQDAGGKFVATASDDKTVRLWNLSDGRLIETLRVPVGTGLEGALYTAAIAPDGRSLVAAGYTGVSWDGGACIYLFDLEKHGVKARLANLPAFVHHLAYSPDGKVIVAALGGKAGIRVWNSTNGKIVTMDEDYSDIASYFSFDNAGRLAVVSFDGFIRLYDPSFTRILKTRLIGGNKPHSVAFSPDGRLLAIGYEDSAKPSVLNSVNLTTAYSPDVSGLHGSLGSVAWTENNGDLILAAAGSAFNADKMSLLRFWSKAGRGYFVDIPITSDTVMDLGTAAGGRVLFASAEPAWGLVSMAGGVDFLNKGILNDFRDIAEGRFAASSDGMVVDFGTQRGGKRPFRFDMKQQELTLDPQPAPFLATPMIKHPLVAVTNWHNDPQPKLFGRPLALDKGEYALSLAIAPDGSQFLIGGDYYLHLFSATGQSIRTQALPGAAWGVNISQNGKVAIAALGDGTVRWYSLVRGSELEELSSVFVTPNGKRWVSWIPEGFFNHSSDGGEKLIGYHLNHGKAKPPEFVSIEQTYQTYYSPRLVSLKLQGDPNGELADRMKNLGDISAALTKRPVPGVDWSEYCPLAQGKTVDGCHPIVTTMATRDFRRDNKPKAVGAEQATFVAELPTGTEGVRLRFNVTDHGGGVGGVDVLQNAMIAGTTRDFRRAATSALVTNNGGTVALERDITLQTGENNVRLKVFDGNNGNYGVSSLIGFRLARGAPVVDQQTRNIDGKPKPRLFILSAGINEYSDQMRLSLPVSDAKDFFDYLKDHPSKVYSGGVVGASFLKDGEVTVPSIAAAFDKIKALKPGEEDRVVIYLSGHGIFNPKEGGYFFITYDADHGKELGFGQQQFLENIGKISTAGGIFLMLDTCHSGAGVSSIVDASRATDGQLEGVGKVSQSLGEKVLVLSAASSGETEADAYRGEKAREYSGKHGPFSVAVLMGLTGGVHTDTDGNIDVIDFGRYVGKQLKDLAEENKHPQKANFKTASDLGDKVFYLTTVQTHR